MWHIIQYISRTQNTTPMSDTFFRLEVAERNLTNGSVYINAPVEVSRLATVGDVYRIATGMLPAGVVIAVMVRDAELDPTSTQLYTTFAKSLNDKVVILFRDVDDTALALRVAGIFGGKSVRRRRSRSTIRRRMKRQSRSQSRRRHTKRSRSRK
jgi:hypothetical protein